MSFNKTSWNVHFMLKTYINQNVTFYFGSLLRAAVMAHGAPDITRFASDHGTL